MNLFVSASSGVDQVTKRVRYHLLDAAVRQPGGQATLIASFSTRRQAEKEAERLDGGEYICMWP
ncbi:hypothetical protein UFOVP1196_50 [uncultured Caudovirales phage]|uniref:Uncharacterized protein n=1 Tax=uncultured Caudovirales phage TaxID=2100421 RepID=A0A6J5R7G0_9CAUD|nr:hypothetical protein UFOVP1196_50 [uncultured Caudovirales phage]